MDTESQRVYDRMRLYQLMHTHPDWSPKSVAETIGRSERWGRTWVQRLKAIATPPLSLFRSQSRAPKSNSALRQADLRLPTSSRTISQILRERGYT